MSMLMIQCPEGHVDVPESLSGIVARVEEPTVFTRGPLECPVCFEDNDDDKIKCHSCEKNYHLVCFSHRRARCWNSFV